MTAAENDSGVLYQPQDRSCVGQAPILADTAMPRSEQGTGLLGAAEVVGVDLQHQAHEPGARELC